METQNLGVELVKLESMESDESNSVLYKVMVNRRIVEKVQMNLVAAEAKKMSSFGANGIKPGQVSCAVVGNCNSGDRDANTNPGALIVDDHNDVESLKQRLSVMQEKYNETFNALNEVRQNALEASERALDREVRVALLEKALHGCEASLQAAEKMHQEALQKVKQTHIDARREVLIYDSQVEQLKRICRERDAKIVALTSQVTRSDVEVANLKRRQADLLQQLTQQQQRFEAMVAESKRRDELYNELEADLKRRDGERQAQLMQEIAQASKEKIRIETKETQMRSLMASKDAFIRQLTGKVQMLESKLEKLSRAFSMVNSDKATMPVAVPPANMAQAKGSQTTQSVRNRGPQVEYIINTPVQCLR